MRSNYKCCIDCKERFPACHDTCQKKKDSDEARKEEFYEKLKYYRNDAYFKLQKRNMKSKRASNNISFNGHIK